VGTADVISQKTNLVERKPAVLWNVGENAIELPLQTWSAGLWAIDDMGWVVGQSLDAESGLWLPVLLKP
jgi:hypothetical protein